MKTRKYTKNGIGRKTFTSKESSVMDCVTFALLASSFIYGMITGRPNDVISGLLEASESAIKTALALCGVFAFFGGMMELMARSGITTMLADALARPLTWLLGKDTPKAAMPHIAMNLSANMLGLDSAATPAGLDAMRVMGDGCGERASNAMCTFLVLNASCVQFLPSTVVAMRSAAGSQTPGAVILPTIAVTLIQTLVGVCCCKLMEKR